MSMDLAKVTIKVDADLDQVKDDFEQAEDYAKKSGRDAVKKWNKELEGASANIDVNGKVRGGRGGGRGGGLGALTVGFAAAAGSMGRVAPIVGAGLAGVGIGAVAAAVGAAKLSWTLYQAADATISLEAAQMAVRESMGLVGEEYEGATERLDGWARTNADALGISQNTLLGMQNVLMTFGQVSKTINDDGGMFDRAMLASIDMAATGVGTAEQNIVGLAKALEDPAKGYTALSRNGVSFNETQVEMIKNLVKGGEVAKAQGVIMETVEKQVGGAAKAAVSPLDQLRSTLGMTASDMGRDIAPAFDNFLLLLKDRMVPQLMTFWDQVSPKVENGIEDFGNWLVSDGMDAFEGLTTWIATDGVTWLGRFADVAGAVATGLNNIAGGVGSALDAIDQVNVDENGNPAQGGLTNILDTVGRTFAAIPGAALAFGNDIYNAGDAFGDDIRTNGFLGSMSFDKDKSMYDKVGSTWKAWDENEKKRHRGIKVKNLTKDYILTADNAERRIPAFAKGGYVTSPTLALVGERGPEYILPEKKLQQMGNVNVVVNVAGDADAPKVKRVVEDSLSEMMQRGALSMVGGM